jgi:TonB-dependent receptor
VPLTVKAGVDWREQIRDLRSPFPRWNFVGSDRVANTADDVASRYSVANPDYKDGGGPYSGLSTVEWPSQYRLYNLFREHPEYFQFDEAATISNSTAASKKIVETISAAYVRLDSKLIDNRLWLVGGVRFERSEDYGEGQLNDIRATYQQDANGRLVLDAAGRPIRVSSDALVRARLQYTERGARARKQFEDYYPSLNATFNITENLLARAAYARTLGRPEFNSIVPSIAITDPTAAAANRTITVSDPSLKPWTGDNFDLSLEYYLKPTGLLSVGVFRKDLTNFFGSVRAPATLEQLEAFGLGDEFLDYEVIRQTNVGDARIDGVEFNFRQELTFLPHWARGVQVFGNLTNLQPSGSNTADFDSFVRRSYSWGVTLSRPKYSVRLNWHARERQQKNLIEGALIPANTYSWTASFVSLDLNCEYRIRKQLAVYAVVRNLTEAIRPDEYSNAATPDYAKQRGVNDSPIRFTLGVKGEF